MNLGLGNDTVNVAAMTGVQAGGGLVTFDSGAVGNFNPATGVGEQHNVTIAGPNGNIVVNDEGTTNQQLVVGAPCQVGEDVPRIERGTMAIDVEARLRRNENTGDRMLPIGSERRGRLGVASRWCEYGFRDLHGVAWGFPRPLRDDGGVGEQRVLNSPIT